MGGWEGRVGGARGVSERAALVNPLKQVPLSPRSRGDAAEGVAFTRAEMDELLRLAEKGIAELVAMQAKALSL